MAQIDASFFNIDPTLVDGTKLAEILNNVNEATLTSNSGTAVPVDHAIGTEWLDTGNAGYDAMNIYTGDTHGSMEIYRIDLATGAITYPSIQTQIDSKINIDGSVAFSAPIAGATPTLSTHLTTKNYTDSNYLSKLNSSTSIGNINFDNSTNDSPRVYYWDTVSNALDSYAFTNVFQEEWRIVTNYRGTISVPLKLNLSTGKTTFGHAPLSSSAPTEDSSLTRRDYVLSEIANSVAGVDNKLVSAECVFDGTLIGTNVPTTNTNVVSVTRVDAGKYTITFDTNMDNTNYSVVFSGDYDPTYSTSYWLGRIINRSLSYFTFEIASQSGVSVDVDLISVIVTGGYRA